MAEIEVAVFAFDSEQKLKLVNRAGERLLAQPAERLMAKSASDLGLADCLTGESTRTLQMSFAGGSGPWEVHRSTFRERGAPHQLLVLSDLSRALRENEKPGSGWFACSGTSSTTHSLQSSRLPAAWKAWLRVRRNPLTGRKTCAAVWESSLQELLRSIDLWKPIRGWRGFRCRDFNRSASARW